jgi:hypothetical protein
MKKSRFIFFAFLSLSLVFLPGCKDDDEPEVSPYIGDYIITKATLSEALVLQTLPITPLEVPAGTIITPMIQTALLGALDCVPESSLIELREDFSLYLSCATSMEELDGGTWEEQSSTVIVLNLNGTAIPSSPTGFVLTVTDVSLIGVALTGTATVPIAREMLAGIVSLMSGGQLTLDLEATPPAVPITFTIELTKQ